MVYFLKAGLPNLLDKVFFSSRSREKTATPRIYHRNKYSSFWRIPDMFFKRHFKYERWSGIYRTNLRYIDIEKFAETWIHD